MAAKSLHNMAVTTMLAEDDLEQGRKFWRDTLGFEEIWADAEYGEIIFQAGDSTFALYQHKGGSKADHTQMVFQVPDVRSMKQQLEGKGVRFEDYDMPDLKTEQGVVDWGDKGQAAWFTDPGGNIIGLVTESARVLEAMGSMATTGVGDY